MKNPLESLNSTIVLGLIITVAVVVLVNMCQPSGISMPSSIPGMGG